MTKSNIQSLFDYLKSERRSLRSLFSYAIFGNIFLLGIPFVIQQLVEQYSILVFRQATGFLILLAIIFLFGVGAMRIFQLLLGERLQRRMFLEGVHRVRDHLHRAQELGLRVDSAKVNYVFESINLQKTLIPLVIDGSTIAVQAILVFTLISFYHPLFFIYSTLVLGGLYVAVVLMGSETEKLSIVESKKKYIVIESLQQLGRGNRPMNDQEMEKVDGELIEYFKTRENRFSHYFRQSISIYAIKIGASALLLTLGGVLVVNNQMTIGQLVASELIITNMLISLFKFTYLLDYWYDSLVAVNKLDENFPLEPT